MSTATTSQVPAVPHGGPVRFTVSEFESMLDSGLFAGRRVELLDGEIYEVTTNPPHDFAVMALAEAFEAVLPAGYHVREEKSIASWSGWRPQPDVAIARGTFRQYPAKSPRPEDLALAVEVCDTSRQDRTKKLEGYADVRIPIYWILDLNARHLEVYVLVAGEARYEGPAIVAEGESVELVIDGRTVGRIDVANVLPPEA